MHGRDSLLALIPARGGSKGLPNKNILQCAGKPLIEWTIAAARAVPEIDEVLVSTDSEEIAAVARRAGAAVPFLRPSELATDGASLLDAVLHAWRRHLRNESPYAYVIVLQPTSPLRTASHIRAALDHYFRDRRSEHDTLASVYEVDRKFGWLMQVDDASGYLRFSLDVRTGNPQRQGLGRLYLPNGAIFVVCGQALEHGFYGRNTLPFVMSATDSIDIDSLDDMKRAEDALRSRA